MMSVLARVPPRSTYPQMTRLLTPCWTPVKERRSRRSSPATAAWIPPRTVGRAQPAPPGSPPPPTRWDCRSPNTLRPSPSRWKQRRLMSPCWPIRDSPSPSCHVTFINTNQRGRMMATPRNMGRTTSCRIINFY